MYCTGGIRCEKASAYFKHRGFENVYQLEGGIIEYTRQVKAGGLESKFIGKNFVFDQRLGERITNDIVSKCHQCGTPCDNHTNCLNDGCHLLFIQCDACKAKNDNCCSTQCQKTIHLPLNEQVRLRRDLNDSNKIFKKGKSDTLLFKNQSKIVHISNIALTGNVKKTQPTGQSGSVGVGIFLGRATHFFTKANIGQFEITKNELHVGDTIIVKGPTTGHQEMKLLEMIVSHQPSITAHAGDIVTIKLPFRVRRSDKLYKTKKV